ncbi:nitrilase-related carbon-nitrogen hydrolase [Desulfobacter vibrioformis]|uniref:nitrilase-related carbon-nitrogen hydrolase n=1 Tax=Desulfobacter vibrioformis TaxID=34031 RepID=UPI00068E0211|nr:nitrilase-related carbon-nitrogen hydrolase [Desulfobacter vibrioformis]
MRIGFCQFELEVGKPEKNYQKARRLLDVEEFDLVILPELFAVGALFVKGIPYRKFSEYVPDGESGVFLHEIARKKNAMVAGGVCEKKGKIIYNTSVLFGPEGYIGRKRKLWIPREEIRHFTKGDLPETYSRTNINAGLFVCADCTLDKNWDALEKGGCQLVCVSANVCGFDLIERAGMEAKKREMYVIFANCIGAPWDTGNKVRYVGNSIIYGKNGEVLLQAGEEEGCGFVDISFHS